MAYAILDVLKQFVNEKWTFFDFFSLLWMYRKFGQKTPFLTKKVKKM